MTVSYELLDSLARDLIPRLDRIAGTRPPSTRCHICGDPIWRQPRRYCRPCTRRVAELEAVLRLTAEGG